MSENHQRIEEEAIAWVLRLRDASADEWEAFTAWLEADPAHGPAYEEAALADQELDGLADRPAPTPHALPSRRWSASRRSVIGWAGAAALVGIIGTAGIIGNDGHYSIATAAGETRTLALADGSRIALNGATKLVLDRDDPRWARLDAGEALFTVEHDEDEPFRVAVGEAMLVDMGTVFDVVHEEGRLYVAVAEGAVRYQTEREVADLSAGMALEKLPGRDALVTGKEPAAIGSWTDGRLSYASATYAEIAADLERNLGLPVTATGEVAQRRFSGTIRLEGERDRLRDRIGALLGVYVSPSGEGWILEARAGASR